ncbi:MAG: hypothetical protein JWO11_31 [Nocardioides sp.]|nr:hypothetical protein [Nocardioides sp.]
MTTTDTTPECCPEYAALSRRTLLGGALLGATTVIGGAVVQTAAASAQPARAVMVVLSLRGAADGMSMVVPYGDPVYYRARPRIAVPAERLLATDGFFGLHPAFRPLLPMWRNGKMAAVHATGLPAPNRSHFSAMEELEDAAPGSNIRSGWLNRLIGLDDRRTTPLQALNVGVGSAPGSLRGGAAFMNCQTVDTVEISGVTPGNQRRQKSLHTLWDGDRSPLGVATKRAFQVVDDFGPAQRTSPKPQHAARYPRGDLGQALATTARTIRGNVGVEVVTIDHGNWDMHSGLGSVDGGQMLQNVTELAQALAAFFTDLGPLADKVTVVALSEFGRRVQENTNRGLDHGYGNVMLLAGAGVKGGRYYGRWPDISDDLDSDLLVTTDYRSVLAEVVASRFDTSTSTVFPNFVRERVGVMQGV